jgi:hypothetical protein
MLTLALAQNPQSRFSFRLDQEVVELTLSRYCAGGLDQEVVELTLPRVPIGLDHEVAELTLRVRV